MNHILISIIKTKVLFYLMRISKVLFYLMRICNFFLTDCFSFADSLMSWLLCAVLRNYGFVILSNVLPVLCKEDWRLILVRFG